MKTSVRASDATIEKETEDRSANFPEPDYWLRTTLPVMPEDSFYQCEAASLCVFGCIGQLNRLSMDSRTARQSSSEARTLHAYSSSNGANLFLLEASTGEKLIADNVEISKRLMILQVKYG